MGRAQGPGPNSRFVERRIKGGDTREPAHASRPRIFFGPHTLCPALTPGHRPGVNPPGSPQREQRPFVLQQPAFALDPTAESRQLTMSAHDAVTRHDDRDRVLSVGGADGARGA